MKKECTQCGNTLTVETQKVGNRISSTQKNGPIYTTKCKGCGASNTDKVRSLIQNV